MNQLMELLKKENYTCVISQNTNIYTETQHGILPILHFLDDGKLEGAVVADKVIGKAAAMMMVLGGVKCVDTQIISQYAYDFFNTHNIPISFEEKVPHIVNRQKNGMCPMEETVLEIQDLQKAYHALKDKIAIMKNNGIKR